MYNSVARIVGDEDKKEKSHNAPVILLLDAKALKSSQSYPAMLIGIGDTKTFEKTSAANGKVIGDSFMLNVRESFRDMKGAVDHVLDLIMAAYD